MRWIAAITAALAVTVGMQTAHGAKPAKPSGCSLEPLDPRLNLEHDFNPGGVPYGPLGPSSLMGRATVGGNTVYLAALGTNSGTSTLEMFFLDATSGTVLDGSPLCAGCAAQPHVTLTLPAGQGFKFTAFGNLNGDGVPDLVAAEAGLASVFVSSVSASGVVTWTQQALTTPPGASGLFGYDVAMGDVDGTGVDAVALTQVPSGSGKSAIRGAVYIYRYANGVVSLSDTITEASVSPSVSSSDFFGSAVAVGDVTGDGRADIVVGASARTSNGVAGAGAIFVFESTATGISRTARVLVPSAASRAGLGSEVVVGKLSNSSGTAIFAATGWGTSSTGGEVFPSPVTNGQVGTLRFAPRTGFDTGWATKKFYAGDVNGDGLADIIVGAPNAGNSGSCPSPGMAYLFLGSNPDVNGNPTAWTRIDWQGLQPGRFGWSVALTAGFPYVIVGQTDADDAFLYRVVP
jgi:hypothetical protein